MIWPMSIMMKAFTSQDDEEIKFCIKMLMDTDAGTDSCTNHSIKMILKIYTRMVCMAKYIVRGIDSKTS